MAVLSRYEIDQTIEVFQNDQEFQRVVVSEHNINLTYEQYKELAETLLEERIYISEYTIEELNDENPPYLRTEIATIYGKTFVERAVYWQTMYTFKYSTVKIFFRTNWQKFLPDYDALQIESNEKTKLFQEAFMREYDRFAKIIDEIYNVVDVDNVPEEYLNYLAQAIGYEREDSSLLNNSSFRELIKNIIEVYKIKGTNYSFELFFNFLGYEATLKEYWFDKRFADPNINSNPETSVTDKKYAGFYFSSVKPTDYIPEGMRHPYIVTHDQIIETLDVNDFTRMGVNGVYTYQQMIGETMGFPDTKYTFFKTNVMEYNLSKVITGQTTESQLDAEDLASIKRYADFLTPLFIQKNIVIFIKPFEDYAESLILTDVDRHDTHPDDPNPSSYFDETMFHLYEGQQPTKYYWDDGTRLYGQLEDKRLDGEKRHDPIGGYENWENRGSAGDPNVSYRRTTDVAPGGHFVSGYHTDTYETIWDRTPGSGSIYDQISIANPTWDSETILIYISSLLSSGSFFSSYEPVRDRDLIPPIIDEKMIYPYLTFSMTDPFEPGTPLSLYANFSFIRGEKKRFSEAFNRINYNKVKIKSIDVDDGTGRAVIVTYDVNRRYAYLSDTTEDITGDISIGSPWVTNVSTADLARIDVGQEIKLPSQLNGFTVTGKLSDRFKISSNATATVLGATITLFITYDFISIFGLKNSDNEGNYQVYSASNTNGETTITLTTTLSGRDQNYESGFIQMYYEEWLLKNFHFPFLFDRVLEFDFVYSPILLGEDEMFWFDSSVMNEEHLLRTYADLNVGEPYPFNIPGQNYTNFPEGVERPLDPELLPSYVDHYLGMFADYIPEDVPDQIYQQWNFFKFAEQNLELRGLYTVPTGTRSSFKFLTELPYYFYDYLDMEKI